jgi:hypothetical protein
VNKEILKIVTQEDNEWTIDKYSNNINKINYWYLNVKDDKGNILYDLMITEDIAKLLEKLYHGTKKDYETDIR